jgi:hypothetical protein
MQPAGNPAQWNYIHTYYDSVHGPSTTGNDDKGRARGGGSGRGDEMLDRPCEQYAREKDTITYYMPREVVLTLPARGE